MQAFDVDILAFLLACIAPLFYHPRWFQSDESYHDKKETKKNCCHNHCNHRIESWELRTESWELRIESWELKVESWKLKVENWELRIENWELKVESWCCMLLYALYSILYTLYFILHTLYFILYTLYFMLYALYFILYTLISQLYLAKVVIFFEINKGYSLYGYDVLKLYFWRWFQQIIGLNICLFGKNIYLCNVKWVIYNDYICWS